jgi:hypothetical protein
MYRGDLVNGEASPGTESLEVALLTEDEIPWKNIAFQVIAETLRLYYEDKKSGSFKTHYGDIIKQSDNSFTVKYF